MLNKIKLIGTLSAIKDKSEENKGSNSIYFSLSVINPSNSTTILRCTAWEELAEKIRGEFKENDLVEVCGYLRNEKEGRQIMVLAKEIKKVETQSENEEEIINNHLRLIGKVIDLRFNEGKWEDTTFRLVWSHEKLSENFFCRVQGEFANEVENKLKKGDIILLEGFLQTKKEKKLDQNSDNENDILTRSSHVIVSAFTLLDTDNPNVFYDLNKLPRTVGEIKKIDFTKPKE